MPISTTGFRCSPECLAADAEATQLRMRRELEFPTLVGDFLPGPIGDVAAYGLAEALR